DCEPVPYYKDAIRVVGLSETMKNLRRDDYRLLIEKYGKAGGKWLECGSSNGDFLRVLSEFDADIYGMENSAEGLKETREKLELPEGHLMQLFPDREDMDIPGAPFDVFLSFNFLEHQPDPVSMLRCLRRNLADDGIGLITVPSFEYIIGEGRYYELIRDHIANYDMNSLTKLCGLCGFEVLEKEFIGIGDTLRVVVRKSSGVPAFAASADNAGRSDISVLAEDYRRMSAGISAYMKRLKLEGRSAALWGAGHQGFTIAATTEIKDNVKYIIDSSVKKQGKYAPASHLRIVSPDEYLKDPVDVIIISAPGYVKEIEKGIRERYKDAPAGVPAVCSILDLTEK
ncbi:MAG: class I SAM-dependent methyltransferase, partial [Eubacteriales bacterium]|nr:class I SAM-dependent methyltransferase [Eubacteriales bacterium]